MLIVRQDRHYGDQAREQELYILRGYATRTRNRLYARVS